MISDTQISDFISTEAHLLDAQAWDDWQAMFTPEGMYWLPANPTQTSPADHVSLIYESAMLRSLRIDRLKRRNGLSVEGGLRTVHHVSNVLVHAAKIGTDDPAASAALHYVEYARGEMRSFHGHVSWHLKTDDTGALKMHLKRVDLLNADGVLSDILGFL